MALASPVVSATIAKHTFNKKLSSQLICHIFLSSSEAFDANLGLCILRVGGGLDCTEMLQRYEVLQASSKFPEYGPASLGPGSAAGFETKSESSGFNRKRIYPSVPLPPTVTFSTLEALETTGIIKSSENSPMNRRANGSTVVAENFPDKTKLFRRDSGSSVASSNVDFMAPITTTMATAPIQETSGSMLPINTTTRLDDDHKPLTMIEEIATRMRSFRKRHHLTMAQREVVFAMNQFREKMKKSTIDVYWLFDDGGK